MVVCRRASIRNGIDKSRIQNARMLLERLQKRIELSTSRVIIDKRDRLLMLLMISDIILGWRRSADIVEKEQLILFVLMLIDNAGNEI